MTLKNEATHHLQQDELYGKNEDISVGVGWGMCVDEQHFFAWLDANEEDNADDKNDCLTQIGGNAVLAELFRAMRRSQFDGATTVIDKHLLYEKVVSISLKMKVLELMDVKKV